VTVHGQEQGDPYALLRTLTRARVGLGRVGDALPTARLLEFSVAHAAARDAVHLPLDLGLLREQLGGRHSLQVRSCAPDRVTYLQRPDLGRRLDDRSAQRLEKGEFDVVFVLADGLSARAVHDHGVALLEATLARLDGWSVAPVVLAERARVAIADDIGDRLGAGLSVVLIGERPGLSSADSLGGYLTYRPRIGRSDAERNCVSNVRPPDGQSYEVAAYKLASLLDEARRRRLSGVALKDDFPELEAPAETTELAD
jgi:ethanolamine ammonia-lyase small subunit